MWSKWLNFLLVVAVVAVAEGYMRPQHIDHRHSWLHATAKSGKSSDLRVRFLVDVKGQGKKGEITFVSATLYQNVLAAQRLAERISDEQFADLQKNNEAKDKADQVAQTELKLQIEALKDVQIKKKIGENGKIFGAITRKALLEHMRGRFPAATVWSPKLSILEIQSTASGENSTGEGDDIRQAGKYTAKINLGHTKVAPALYTFEIVSD